MELPEAAYEGKWKILWKGQATRQTTELKYVVNNFIKLDFRLD